MDEMAATDCTLENSYASKATEKLYLSDHRSDVNFAFEIDGGVQKVSAHKFILATLSSVFDAMFYGPVKETGDVKIVDASIETFKEFLKLFYLPSVDLSMEHMKDVMRLADKYDVLDQMKSCIQNFEDKLTLDNVCWAYQLSVFVDDARLKSFCERYIMAYPKEIFEMDKFCYCDQVVLKQMLKIDSIACDELDIFDACLKWAEFNCNLHGIDDSEPSNWRVQLGDCVEEIRLESIDIHEFIQHTASFGSKFFTSEEMSNIIYARASKSGQILREPRSKTVLKDLFKEFTTSESLICPLQILSGSPRPLDKINVIHFSVSCPVVLKKVSLARIYQKDNDLNDLRAESRVELFELSDKSFEESVTEENLLTIKSNKLSEIFGGDVEMHVLLNPRKMYKIKWKLVGHRHLWCFKTASEIVTLDDRLDVEFHHLDQFSKDSAISSLTFAHLNELVASDLQNN